MGALPDPPKIPEILSGARFLKFWEFLKIFPRRGPAGCLYFCRKMAKNRDFPGGEKSGNFSPPAAPRPGKIFKNSQNFKNRAPERISGIFGGSGRALHPPLGEKNFRCRDFFGEKKKFSEKKKFFRQKKKFFFPSSGKKFFFPARNALRASTP